MAEFTEIPVIDISALRGDDAGALMDLAAQFRETYATTGFGYVVGHGIDPGLVDRVFAASARFHALPRDAKMAIALNAAHRGFIPIDTSTDVNSTLAEVTRPNHSESFMMMREDAPGAEVGSYLAGANQWPDLDGFRDDVTAYHEALTGLGRAMVRLVAHALEAPVDALMPGFDTPTTWLRLLYYPPTDPMAGDDLYGSAPHCDFGFLTILAQDDIGGLQVQTPDGAWVDAPRIPGSFVVNVGDMLHRWSNGILKSTPHRVINRSGRARYSCPFFFDPHVSTVIAPLETCVSAERPCAFDPLEFGAFLKSELEAGYEAHQSAET
jgi:isopenicillin N synthase-like dioxygenase